MEVINCIIIVSTCNLMQEALETVAKWIKANNIDSELKLDFLDLESLPPIPNTCQRLNCSHNKLTSLPALPNCRMLFCQNNWLTELPDLPNCERLDCKSNQLTRLPQLAKIVILYCENNKLTFLPPLPKCFWLLCGNNLLTVLPELLCCDTLACGNNKLTGLPALPKCKYLDCADNFITYFPALPGISKSHLLYENNKYLYISKRQAIKWKKAETVNYNKYARIIQRNFKNHLRKKLVVMINTVLFAGPAKIVSLYTV